MQQHAHYSGPDSIQLGNNEQLPITYTSNTTLQLDFSSLFLNASVAPMRNNLLSINFVLIIMFYVLLTLMIFYL